MMMNRPARRDGAGHDRGGQDRGGRRAGGAAGAGYSGSGGTPTPSFAKPARNQSGGPAATSFRQGERDAGGVRLQKVLARAGVASRRASEALIAEGRVEVDGEVVTRQGMRIDPTQSVVRVDGIRVVIDDDMVYLSLNKPRGWQSTMSDERGRACIGDALADRVASGHRIFHVGRLDAETEGLILLTNDGELAHRLMHPSYGIVKTYVATIDGRIPRDLGRTLRGGVELDDGPASVDAFKVLEMTDEHAMVRVALHEGRKRIVRRLFSAAGHPVTRLVRTGVGPVALGDQRPGATRALGRGEISDLYGQVGL